MRSQYKVTPGNGDIFPVHPTNIVKQRASGKPNNRCTSAL
jgi:hypothetical protein